ncbi:hypothetical protein [Acidovorax sp. Leaf73]|uniref:hypothetical protein n=1 Tax=Acidovorax sp. Leaf73 TaxID=2876566 RepID=UPI001E47BFC2|nr:hypothetical protein [Acidovorax sp. Leaf73]
MADATSSAAEIVNDKYDRSIDLANAATAAVEGFQAALNASVYQPPTMSFVWNTLAAPVLPPIPDLPELPEIALAIPGGMPSTLTDTVGNVTIDDFDVEMPTLNFGVAPTLNIGTAPVLPEVRDVALPDAPTVILPDAPEFLTLQAHSFGGINLHEDWLDKLDDIPELSVLQPAPFAYSPGARYASQLLDNLKATLNARIQGGTGLAPAVEQAIWDRSRDRETQIALAKEQEVLRASEALGFALPSGVLAGQLADARREYNDKLSGLSRDVAIKQAELEQANLQQATTLALQLESTLLDDAYKLEVLAVDLAKTAADNAIACHNAALEQYKALLAGYQAYASAYQTVIQAELNKVEVFKALLQAEQTKADINRSLVERFKAEIEGAMAAVQIYQARVGAAKTLVELEGTRIQAGAEQVKAFVATVNAETAKSEMYKATISAEATKVEAVGTLARAYGAKVGAQAERARVEIAKLQVKLAAKGLEWDGWKTQLAAASAQVEAASRKSAVMVDGYRAGASAAEAQAGAVSRVWESNIRQYEAGKSIAAQVAKANTDAVLHANDARMEAAKVGLTTSSQRLASAWAMVSANASISGSASLSQTI